MDEDAVQLRARSRSLGLGANSSKSFKIQQYFHVFKKRSHESRVLLLALSLTQTATRPDGRVTNCPRLSWPVQTDRRAEVNLLEQKKIA